MITLKIQSASPYRLREGVRVRVHQHALAQLEVVVEGTCVLVEPDREQVLQAGSWAWLGPHVSHGWRSQTAVRCVTFKCSVDRAPARDTRPLVAHSSSFDAWLAGVPERASQAWATGTPGMHAIANQLLSAAIGLTMQSREPGALSGLNERWRVLIADLRQPTTAYLSLTEMAKRVHLSPSHFRRQFKVQFSTSPARYQHERKMEWARDILQYTSIPMKEVVAQLGYSDLSAFSKAFAKHFGRRPRELRRGCDG